MRYSNYKCASRITWALGTSEYCVANAFLYCSLLNVFYLLSYYYYFFLNIFMTILQLINSLMTIIHSVFFFFLADIMTPLYLIWSTMTKVTCTAHITYTKITAVFGSETIFGSKSKNIQPELLLFCVQFCLRNAADEKFFVSILKLRSRIINLKYYI